MFNQIIKQEWDCFVPRNDMKYTRLTKEQFEELHPEFVNFLATKSIDKGEWDKIKAERPEVAEQELDVFSDLIWEGVLSRAEYLEHFSKNHIFFFFSSLNPVCNSTGGGEVYTCNT